MIMIMFMILIGKILDCTCTFANLESLYGSYCTNLLNL